jgi:hypothetical protein
MQLSDLEDVLPTLDQIVVQFIPVGQSGQPWTRKSSDGTEIQPPNRAIYDVKNPDA